MSIRRFGVWRAAIWLLGLGDIAAVLGWLMLRPEPPERMVVAVLFVATLAMLWLLRSLLRSEPLELRWDGRAWHLGPALDRMKPGDVTVALDLGPWLLLRFTEAWPPGPPWRRRVHWLPLQRRGLGASWHAVRCAVYTPRPVVDAVAGKPGR